MRNRNLRALSVALSLSAVCLTSTGCRGAGSPQAVGVALLVELFVQAIAENARANDGVFPAPTYPVQPYYGAPGY